MSFGESASNYHMVRQAYPNDIFNHIKNQVSNIEEKSCLDLGCGTGIATIEIKNLSFGKVVGCDIDQDMIQEALKHKNSAIKYTVAPTNHLPFESHTFDVISAFGSFHWFCDNQSIHELKRVLKPNGIFFVINKNDPGEFRNEILQIVSQYSVLKQATAKMDYYPNEILTNFNFKNVQEFRFSAVEKFDLAQLLLLVQSMQFWSHLAIAIKPIVLDALSKHFSKKLHQNCYKRQLHIDLIQGIK